MSEVEMLYEVIDSIDDKYIAEAFQYKKRRPFVSVMAAVAACLCICIGIHALYGSRFAAPVTVYAYGTDQEIGWKQPTHLTGTIEDNGVMHHSPLEFYISGKSIEKIRFSVKNQYILFMDWTEKREDYGTSKSFAIDYGDEADYYYLVIEWDPVNTIRALTDNTEIGITDLPEEDREDIIVMQITYENGKEDTCAINIHLTDDGKFQAETVPYKITDADTFVLDHDVVNVPAYGTGDNTDDANRAEDINGADDSEESESSSTWSNLPEDKVSEITEFVKEWDKESLPYEVVSITPDNEETERQGSEYEGYGSDEILVLRVTVKDEEVERYITIGSTDDWQNFDVLNEGY